MKKIDLFESLTRYLAIKPIPFDSFDIEKAKESLKEENKEAVTFIADHGYFEDLLETLAKRVRELEIKDGHLYLYVKGKSCKARFEKNLLELILSLKSIYIVGEQKDWPIQDPKITFSKIEDKFADNHQRFFIYQSPSFQSALVARHNKDGEIEAAMTSDPEAVAFLAQIIGTKALNG